MKRNAYLVLGIMAIALSGCAEKKAPGNAGCSSNADCEIGEMCAASECIDDPTYNDGGDDFTPSDRDNDGVPDGNDNCIDVANPTQVDTDNDKVGDACDTDNDNDDVFNEDDNCPSDYNPSQADADGDGRGDACDSDLDDDGIADEHDNCPEVANPGQNDQDADGTGDLCDEDIDEDFLPNHAAKCPSNHSVDQEDMDGDSVGDLCDDDVDGDDIANDRDNCPTDVNALQNDQDQDGIGDVCDADRDGDNVSNDSDNCPTIYNPTQDAAACSDFSDQDGDGVEDSQDNCVTTPNPEQPDGDNDGIGDACDNDIDNDGVPNTTDNCPTDYNPNQSDVDHDGSGDVCDNFGDQDGDGVEDNSDNCPATPNPDQADTDVDGEGDACDEPDNFSTDHTWSDRCVYEPPVSNFSPDVEWAWPLPEEANTISYPTKVQVMSSPIVINLTDDNGDGVIDENDTPEVAFISFDTWWSDGYENDPRYHHLNAGVLRIVDGATGRTRVTVGGTGKWLSGASNLAAADIDNDGEPEIIALKNEGKGLIAFNADGSVKWNCSDAGVSSCFETGSWFNWGGVSIADMDLDGTPEITYGNRIFHADGRSWPILNSDNTIRSDLELAADGQGDNFKQPTAAWNIGSLSYAIDMDGDNSELELIAGRTIYTYSASLDAWTVDSERSGYIQDAIYYAVTDYPNEQDGFPATVDLGQDLMLEMVIVANEQVILLDDDGFYMDYMHIPGEVGFAGGAPTIADFDGDGFPEIGVAGDAYYTVFDIVCELDNWWDCGDWDAEGNFLDYTLQILWQSDINEVSSSRTGSSVFDFDADGRAEVIYNDEETLYIYTFHDGNPPAGAGYSYCDDTLCVWEMPNSSFTAYEYPVIADLDNDGNAEIAVAANDFGRTNIPGVNHGVVVYGDGSDNWVSTRRIWNQHAYHITNIEEDGSVPAVQDTFWWHNSFRQNFQGTAEEPDLRAPDLIVGQILTQPKCDDGMIRLGIWVVNQGSLQVGAGIVVAITQGSPTGAVLGTAVTTQTLNPGDAELVVIELTTAGSNGQDAYVIVDYATANNECNEINNAINIGMQACQ